MDQSTFTKLTGITPDSSQSARFDSVSELASDALEEMLGWPLDPTDWGNQYIEIGKTRDEDWSYPDVDTSDLDSPDAVIGQTRLYSWNVADPYLHIDPATAVYAVKLVKDGITYKTFDPNEYTLQLQNGTASYGRYIKFIDRTCSWMLSLWPHPAIPRERYVDGFVQIAIDADWAFAKDDNGDSTLPTALQKVWADLMYYELNVNKRGIKSESMLSHSYTRDAQAEPVTVHATTIAKYVGPRGTLNNETVVV